jgi:hypothetical protein
MRLTIWGKRQGLSLRQNIQFAQLGFFYLLSFATIIIVLSPVLALAFDVYPFVATHTAYALHFWPFAVAIELMLISIADGLPYETLWRARQTWLGMTPVYAKAAIIALVYGPNRKPAYRVTRKEHACGLHFRGVLSQILIFLALIVSSLYHIATHSLLRTADLGSLFWAALFALGLSRVVRNSWHGVALSGLAVGVVRRYSALLSGWALPQVAAFKRLFSSPSHPTSPVLPTPRGRETGFGSGRVFAAKAIVERNWREGSH